MKQNEVNNDVYLKICCRSREEDFRLKRFTDRYGEQLKVRIIL